MKVQFWFDPICPFCWVTSRWLVNVAPERDLEIEWRPISLFFKDQPDEDSGAFEPTRRTRDLLRVVESVRAGGGADKIGALYTELGRHIHNRQELDFNLGEILEGLDIDKAHAAALDDESFDTAIRDAMAEALALTGDDVGTPIVAIPSGDDRVGFFGPVISVVPEGNDALQLWDGFVAMATVPSMYEFKRTRDVDPQPPPESSL